MEKIKGEANFKNGFQIIITNLDNGEELLNEKSNAIIGAISEENRNRGIAFTACNAYTFAYTSARLARRIDLCHRQ